MSTGRPGDPSPFAIGLLLRRAHTRAAAHFAGLMAPLGLELRHLGMLIVLVERGPTLQRDLAAHTGHDKAAVGRAVDDLEAAGLVCRRGVAGDRRVWMVHLTAAGERVFDDAHHAALAATGDLTGVLGSGETEQLLDLLTRLAHPPGEPATDADDV